MAWWKKTASLIEKHEIVLGIALLVVFVAILVPLYLYRSPSDVLQEKDKAPKKHEKTQKHDSKHTSDAKPISGSDNPQVTTITTSDKRGDTGGPSADTFSVTSIYSVYIYAHWKNIEGSHDEVVKFYAPDGELYQTIRVPFTTYKLPSMKKKPSWSPHEVDIILAPKENGAYVVRAELPVAGTWAMRITGTWKAKIFLDDNSNSYGEASFKLIP